MRYFTNDDDLKGMFREIKAKDLPSKSKTYKIPGPYDIAMAFGAAMVASGKCETIGAAMAQAWMAIPEFYQARDQYLREMVPMMAGISPAEDAGSHYVDPDAEDTNV